MTKRRVGFEITAHCIRMAIFTGDKENPTLLSHKEQPLDDTSDISALLLEMLGSRPGFADRFCTTLPISRSFVRQLKFPFSDPRKIDAAARMELSAQLPTDISRHIVATTPPQNSDDGSLCTAATADSEQIGELLAPFEQAKLPLQTLGLSPLTEAGGLRPWLSNGLLVLAHEQQLVLSLVQQGEVVHYETCGPTADDPQQLARQIMREAALLCRSARVDQQPLCLIGSEVSTALSDALKQQEQQLVELPWAKQPRLIDPALLPVCAQALAADQPTINFRRGPFTLKSEWAALKKHLFTGGALLLMALTISAATAWRSYQHKTDIAEGYRKQMTQVFKQTLPNTRAIVDIPMQMQSALQQLKQTGQLVGLDKSTSALAVLRTISSHTPKDVTIDIKHFSYEPQALVLDGTTNSFDSVNRLASELRKAAIFGEVRIADAKTGIDGQQISFRLQLTIGQQGGQQ